MIKNSDGSPYKIRKPNPLMLQQEIEEQPIEVIHNFSPEEIVLQSKGKKKITTAFPATIGVMEPHPQIQEQIKANELVEEEYIPEVKEEIESDNKVNCWCLPADWKDFYDPLYEETRKNLVYGNKFMFEGIVLNADETDYQMWMKAKIKPSSIVFVSPNRRWWKVIKVTESEDGFIVNCMPSLERPSFE
jgi:hypothetical protein